MAVEEVCVIKGMQLLYERFRLIVVLRQHLAWPVILKTVRALKVEI